MFFSLSQLYSTSLGLLWCLLCASTTCIAGLCFNVCILEEESRTKIESNFSLLCFHLCSFSCTVTSKLLVSPWNSHVHMTVYLLYLFSYGNLLTMRANTSGACGTRCGKFWLVKANSFSEVLLLFCVPSRGKERYEERCQKRI